MNSSSPLHKFCHPYPYTSNARYSERFNWIRTERLVNYVPGVDVTDDIPLILFRRPNSLRNSLFLADDSS